MGLCQLYQNFEFAESKLKMSLIRGLHVFEDLVSCPMLSSCSYYWHSLLLGKIQVPIPLCMLSFWAVNFEYWDALKASTSRSLCIWFIINDRRRANGAGPMTRLPIMSTRHGTLIHYAGCKSRTLNCDIIWLLWCFRVGAKTINIFRIYH